jgi:2-keto-4-pentenoate hydratase/2-oxohepta-3-ene-1,7-dioic acid hydratase in catechol pathway
MRIANLAGRATIVTEDGIIDVATGSNGAFSSSLDRCITQLDVLKAWFDTAHPEPSEYIKPDDFARDPRLGAVVSSPQQIFAIGLNYRHHASEMNTPVPNEPMVFTKFSSSLCGPNDELPIRGTTTDFEAELVVVIGTRSRDLSVKDALGAVAGYCVGQDFSERSLQMRSTPPQFSFAKSHRNFAPIGPWLTTADEFVDPNNFAIRCCVNDIEYQNANTNDMIFPVAEIMSYLSAVVELRPGDLIFTGTPHGVGQGHNPPIFLQPGDHVVTEIEGLGRIANTAV